MSNKVVPASYKTPAWDRHNNVAYLNPPMGSEPFLIDEYILCHEIEF